VCYGTRPTLRDESKPATSMESRVGAGVATLSRMTKESTFDRFCRLVWTLGWATVAVGVAGFWVFQQAL